MENSYYELSCGGVPCVLYNLGKALARARKAASEGPLRIVVRQVSTVGSERTSRVIWDSHYDCDWMLPLAPGPRSRPSALAERLALAPAGV